MDDDPRRPLIGRSSSAASASASAASEDAHLAQTTVVEGGPASALFLPEVNDADSDSDLDLHLGAGSPAQTSRTAAAGDGAGAGAGSDADSDSDLFAGVGDAALDGGRSRSTSQRRRRARRRRGTDADADADGDADEDDAEEDDDDEDTESFVDDDEADPIERRYALYSSASLAQSIYLLQYPLRTSAQEYAAGEVPLKARFKPLAGWVEVDVPIPETAYYDAHGASRWTGQALQSQTVGGMVVQNRHYAVGLRDEGDNIHLTAVAGVAQLRPLFKHMDQRDDDARAAVKAESDRPAGPARAVQVAAKSQGITGGGGGGGPGSGGPGAGGGGYGYGGGGGGDGLPHETPNAAALKAFQEEPFTELAWHAARSSDDAAEGPAAQLVSKLEAGRREPCIVATEARDYLDLLSTQSGAIAAAKKQQRLAAAAAAATLIR